MNPPPAETFAHTEALFRGGAFVFICVVMLAWETLSPRRNISRLKRSRWTNNLSIAAINTLVVRIGLPLSAYALAVHADQLQLGLFNLIALPEWFAIIFSIVLLDASIYFQHRLFHAVPLLWRLHRMHHSDVDIDASTGIRFHPIEIAISMLIKMGVVVITGAPPLAILIFEIILNAMSLFNHGNVAIPIWLDIFLRWIVVTPDMHRVHHSIDRVERNRNFGFNFPHWDYCFGTYQDQPKLGHLRMTIGLNSFRDPPENKAYHLLLQPFK